RRLGPGPGNGREGIRDLRRLPAHQELRALRVLLQHGRGAPAQHQIQSLLLRRDLGFLMRRAMRVERRNLGVRVAGGLGVATALLLAGCGQVGSITDTRETIVDRDLSAIAAPGDAQPRPVERVPRSQFGVVNPAPLSERDQPAFVYPSLDADERASMLEGLTFFTTPHTASEVLGPVANQTRCMGCHLSGDDNLSGCITTNSHVTRAARATPTNFRYAAFTIFGDFSPSAGTFDPLAGFSGFVQHTRPSLPACLPDPILPVEVDPILRGGIDPATGLSPLGIRRAVGERAGPPYIGRGLMEAIPAEELIQQDDPTDARDSNSSLRASVPRFP